MPDPSKEQAAYAEALKLIKACRQRGEVGNCLDLSDLGLSKLPPEIGQLTELTSLYLQRNQLSTLPPEIGKLTSLTSLDLDNNHLSALPPVDRQAHRAYLAFPHVQPTDHAAAGDRQAHRAHLAFPPA